MFCRLPWQSPFHSFGSAFAFHRFTLSVSSFAINIIQFKFIIKQAIIIKSRLHSYCICRHLPFRYPFHSYQPSSIAVTVLAVSLPPPFLDHSFLIAVSFIITVVSLSITHCHYYSFHQQSLSFLTLSSFFHHRFSCHYSCANLSAFNFIHCRLIIVLHSAIVSFALSPFAAVSFLCHSTLSFTFLSLCHHHFIAIINRLPPVTFICHSSLELSPFLIILAAVPFLSLSSSDIFAVCHLDIAVFIVCHQSFCRIRF